MPITRILTIVVRPLVKPLIGLGFMAALGVAALGQFGVSLDDIRGGQFVPSLMAKFIQQAGGFDGIEGIEGLDEGSLAGMLEQANLGDPGGVQAMLRANGSLRGQAGDGKPTLGEKPRGVVIFSPDGPGAETGGEQVGEGEKPAPIVRVHRREAS